MAKASKDADRLIRLWDRSMYRPGVGPGSAGLARRGWAFFTRSTARGVLDGCRLPPTADSRHPEMKSWQRKKTTNTVKATKKGAETRSEGQVFSQKEDKMLHEKVPEMRRRTSIRDISLSSSSSAL